MKVLIVCALIAVVAANAPYEPEAYSAPAYRAPAYKPAAYSKPNYEDEPKPIAPYAFAYNVNDEYDNHGRKEVSDGSSVSGSYHVDLPDGRRQTVTYRSDPYSGFVADVKFEGEAKYPEDDPTYKAPVYKAPTAYKAAPAYAPAAYAAPAYAPEPAYQAPVYKSYSAPQY